MAPSEVIDPSSKVPTRSIYRAFWEAIPFVLVKKDTTAPQESNAVVVEEEKHRENLDGVTTESKEKREEEETEEKIDEQKTVGVKVKKKFGKKKEIVSSSTVVPRLEVCIGKKCKAKGSEALLAEFQTASNGRVEIAHTKCMHECKQGMNTRVTKDGTTFEWHHGVTSMDVASIVCKHFDW